jgi:hypothetical protein
LDKPFLGQATQDGIDRPFRKVDFLVAGDCLDEGVSVVASPGEAGQDGQLQDPFSQLGYFIFHVITKYNVIHSSMLVKLFLKNLSFIPGPQTDDPLEESKKAQVIDEKSAFL